MKVSIVPYDPAWPSDFEIIKANLASDLAGYKTENLTFNRADYLSIEHVGSTAVPGLAAKPIIDILIVIACTANFEGVRHALLWGDAQGGYRLIGDGGVQGRWSFKLYNVLPARNVYVVVKDSLACRSYLALKNTLCKDETLRDQYGRVKLGLARREWRDVMEYAAAKDGIVRKILEKAGWSKEEIDEKERRSVKGWFGVY